MIIRSVVVFAAICVVSSGKGTLHVKPSITKTIEKKTGENFLMQCKVTAEEGDSVTTNPNWIFISKDGKESKFSTTGKNRVKFIDANSTHLFITNTELDDAGSYKCVATVTNSDGNVDNLELIASVTIYAGIQTIDFKERQNPIEGDTARIECRVSAIPKPEINWYILKSVEGAEDDIPIDATGSGKYSFEERGQILLISNYHKDHDDGTYMCNVNQAESGDLKELKIVVDGYTRPTVSQVSSDPRFLEDKSGELSCMANGYPKPTFKWLKDDGYITEGDVYSVPDIGRLKILSATADEVGTYVCEIENAVGKDRKNISITVYLKPRIIAAPNETVQKGNPVSIDCIYNGSGDLVPEWRFRNNKIEPIAAVETSDDASDHQLHGAREQPNKYVIHENGTNKITLKILETVSEDAGAYECVVKNDAGTASTIAHVKIEHKPIVSTTNADVIRGLDEHPIEIACSVDSLPPAGWSWFKDDSQLDNSPPFQIITEPDNAKSTLKIEKAAGHYGQYTCKAANNHGSNEHSFNVIKTEIPPRPAVLIDSSKPTKAVVNIQNFIAIEDSKKPDTVLIKYVKVREDLSDDWYTQDVESKSQNFTYSQDGVYSVSKLTPDTQYKLAITAENQAGMAEWVAQDYTTSRPEVPSRPVYRISNFSDCLQMCVVAWDAADDGGSSIEKYEVQYKLIDDPVGFWTTSPPSPYESVAQSKEAALSQFEDKMAKEPVDREWSKTVVRIDEMNRNLNDFSVELMNVVPKSTYVVRVYAYNGIGPSEPTADLYLRTSEFAAGDLLTGGVNAGAIVSIVILVVLIFVLMVDVACYYVNQCGLLMCLCVNCCGKTPPEVKAKEIDLECGKAISEDKKPLEDDEMKGEHFGEDTPMIVDEKTATLKKDTPV